jgi:hypothetical protein
MAHILRVFIITAFGLVLCGTAWAAEAEVRSKGKEIEQVRDLIYKEIAGHIKGDPDQIMSCYADAPGTAIFLANGRGPETWTVAVAGDSLRTQYAGPKRDNPSPPSNEPQNGREVIHVDVKDNHAIAVSRHWGTRRDSTAQETIFNESRSVWMLAKIEGEWKITSALSAVTSDQKVRKWGPK